MPLDIQGTFVSQKISKVRWIPEEYVETKHFFTGSWDNEDNNSLKVWCFERPNEDEDIEYPRQLSEFKLNGDVTEIKFVEKNRVAVSSSEGDIRLLEISLYDRETPLKEIFIWKKLHNFGAELCSCTALDTLEGDLVAAGEDGIVNILSCRRGEVLNSIPEADSCSIQSVCYLKHSEIITGNVRGHMKIWDFRASLEKPSASFLLTENQQAVTCIVNHPTQPHIILAGSEEGSLAVWDLRVNTFPASSVAAHAAAINEMHFHPDNPQKLLTCSASGEIWDWNMEMMTRSTMDSENRSVTTWLPIENKMMVNSLMSDLHKSVNTLHVDKSRVLCGADNEAVYVIRNYVF